MAHQKSRFGKPVKKQTLAEQMVETIEEAILAGQLESGDPLPTEPELADQFKVSRAVVRDATRILMARGLVEVKHGLGVFVTEADNEAFSQALFLALRRAGATVWDVEQFEQAMLPEVVALAAKAATDEELDTIQQRGEAYLQMMADHQAQWWQKEAPAEELERLRSAYQQVMQLIFVATHNRLFQQLARPLLGLRSLRQWAEGEAVTPEKMLQIERDHFEQLMAALASREPARARAIARQLVQLPPEAEVAMRQTPIGQTPYIPVPPLATED